MSPAQAVVLDRGGTLIPWQTTDLAEQWRVCAQAHPGYAHEVEVSPAGGRCRQVAAGVLGDDPGYDAAVYTSEIAPAKPHPEVLRAALGAVDVDDLRRPVYVGDRPYEDVHGAQRVGMRAVLVPHSDIPADQQVPVDVVDPWS